MIIFLNALQQSLIFIPLTLGIYLTYQVLAITDLTPDGTFVLGAAIFARLITNGYSQFTSIALALIGGMIAGIIVGCMQRFAKINSLIASILAVFMLYSINFSVLNQPNINLLSTPTLLGSLQLGSSSELTVYLFLFFIALLVIFFLLLNSRVGLTLRAFGVNKKLLTKLGRNSTFYLFTGLALANMLAALCGVMTAQINGYADINMGVGMALTGIGAVVIGCKLMRTLFLKTASFNIVIDLAGCFIGTYIYFTILNFLLSININPIYLKLLLGIMLVIFLSTANYSRKNQGILSDD